MKTKKNASSNTVLAQALEKIRAAYGPGAVMTLGEGERPPVPAISTGSRLIDGILGVGGMPRGRIVEVFGPESSGKTTLALQLIASAHRLGGQAAFVDAEHALDPSYAARLGVDLGRLILSQPGSGEEALEIAEALVRSTALDVVVVDSVAALVPRAELEGAMGDAQVGLQARLMSQAMRKLTGAIARTGCIVLFINQIREKIGMGYGPSTTTSGGRALKFFASVRIEVRRAEAINDKGTVIGNRTKIKVVKNKVAPPFRETVVDIYYGRGICPHAELLRRAEESGLVEKNGSWLRFGAEQLGQGSAQAREFLRLNPTVATRLSEALDAQSPALAA